MERQKLGEPLLIYYRISGVNLASAVDRSHQRVTRCFINHYSRLIFPRSYASMHSRNNSIHAENAPMHRLWLPASLYLLCPYSRPCIREITASMLKTLLCIHAENPAGESRYEMNCRFAAPYLCVAYRDIGKGREQDAEALPIGT